MGKKLLLMIIAIIGLFMSSCDNQESDYMYSIFQGYGVSYAGIPQNVADQKISEFSAYLKSLNIPIGSENIKIIKAKTREEANQKAVAWFNSNVSRVSNDKVNSFEPVSFYISYQLVDLPENSSEFKPYGELKEFGDLSLKGDK